jgi:hypothetical protein
MLGLVSVTLVVLSSQFSYDLTRTRVVAREAQLSQLLLAGAQDAQERLRGSPEKPRESSWQVELPAALSRSGAKLMVEANALGNQKTEVIVEAKMGGQSSLQTLHFRHVDGAWLVDSAELAGAK